MKEIKDRIVLNASSIATQLERNVTHKRQEMWRRTIREQAAARVDKILTKDWDEETKGDKFHFLSQKILKLYGFSSKEVKSLSISQAHKTALKLVASDLLITEFYEIDGQKTDFANRCYPDIAPEEYTAITGRWSSVKHILENKVKDANEGKLLHDEYIGEIGLKGSSSDDIVATYAAFFGKDSIISIPIDLSLSDSYISVDYEDSFVEPYGGEYADRLVFVRNQ